MATMVTGLGHSAGGVGGVFGSKNLKAIGVRGTGAVKLAAAANDWKELVHYALTLTGAEQPALGTLLAPALGRVQQLE